MRLREEAKERGFNRQGLEQRRNSDYLVSSVAGVFQAPGHQDSILRRSILQLLNS
jgi:hypothetical protein